MKTLSLAQPLRSIILLTGLLLLTAGCKKETVKDPLEDCRPPTTGTGIGIPNARNIMFWTAQDFKCGALNFVSIRNTTLNTYGYGGPSTPTAMRVYGTQPVCGAAGAINIQVSKGYVYEYLITCSNLQWKGTLTADCNDDCIAIQLK